MSLIYDGTSPGFPALILLMFARLTTSCSRVADGLDVLLLASILREWLLVNGRFTTSLYTASLKSFPDTETYGRVTELLKRTFCHPALAVTAIFRKYQLYRTFAPPVRNELVLRADCRESGISEYVPADMAQTHSLREKRSGGCAFVYEKIETFVWSVRTGYEKILHPVRIPVIWQRDAPQTDSKPVFTDILTIMKSKTVSLSRYMCR